MAKRILLLSSMLTFVCQIASATLDLTPQAREYTSQGFIYVQLSFKDDDGRVCYNPPLNWTYRGSAARLQLTPPNKSLAQATIEAVPGAQPFTPELQQTLVHAAVAGVPPGSQAVEVVKQEENTVLIDGRGSFEVTLSYKALGETFERSVVFASVADLRLCFRLTARTADFATVKAAFHASLGSWHRESPAAKTAMQPPPQTTVTR
jgi:hypothetical protein